jgi:hypothetical protein
MINRSALDGGAKDRGQYRQAAGGGGGGLLL